MRIISKAKEKISGSLEKIIDLCSHDAWFNRSDAKKMLTLLSTGTVTAFAGLELEHIGYENLGKAIAIAGIIQLFGSFFYLASRAKRYISKLNKELEVGYYENTRS